MIFKGLRNETTKYLSSWVAMIEKGLLSLNQPPVSLETTFAQHNPSVVEKNKQTVPIFCRRTNTH